MIISLDCETTGLDLIHGAAPFLVTTCEDNGTVRFWEWDVNPLTRQPEIPDADLVEIADLIDAAELIYLQNSKFDVRALDVVGVVLPWEKVRDTLVMGHLLASNHKHNLTDMAFEYLEFDIQKLEDAVEGVVKVARGIVRSRYPHWAIAKEGRADMPSVKPSSGRDDDKAWKADMWLPKALLKARCPQLLPEFWQTVCAEYANGDSETTILLGLEMERRIRNAGLWAIYEHRLNLPRVACEMEMTGVTAIGDYTESTIQEYQLYSAEAECALVDIAAGHGHRLELAEGAALNDNMRDFFYGAESLNCPRCDYVKRVKHWNGEQAERGLNCPKCAKSSRTCSGTAVQLKITQRDNLNLPVIRGKKTGNASLDKDVMAEYTATLDGEQLEFIQLMLSKRKHDTDLGYMESYRRFWVPVAGAVGFYRIHPSLNPCGTDHLRWASNSTNLQNVGKQEDEERTSMRRCFGPAPGRDWWSMDFQNIELRIPAYESGEEAMIELFEKPNEPPYFGSYHCLNASIVYPDLFWPLAEKDGAFKKQYKSAEYQWCKNGGFALQYGCGEKKADSTFRRKGAYRKLKEKLPKVAALNERYVYMAEKTGWVETLPDRLVDPTRGYPILASRTEDGGVLSTTPFNYHVSGTACWCKNTALVRCSAQCAEWRAEGFDARMVLEIHDEIIFDFPRGACLEENKARAMVLRKLMEQSGEDLIPRIPTPVSVEYHTVSWAEGVSC